MKVTGNTVLITGCGMGIGKLAAEALAKAGNDIIGLDVSSSLLRETKSSVEAQGRTFIGYVCDLSKQDKIAKTIQTIQKKNQSFQILINNAGIAPSGAYVGKDFSVWKKAIEINFIGLSYLTYISIPILQKHETAAIINLASIAGKFGTEGTVMYSATKHAVVGFSQALRMEYYEKNIEVSWVCPTMAKTRMIDGVKPSFFTPVIEPDQVVGAILYAIEKNPGEVLVPSSLRFTLAILPAMFPRFAMWLAVRTKASRGWLTANKGLEKNIPR